MHVANDAIGAVAKRRSGSLTSIVQEEVERMILNDELEAGQRLNEQHLAEQLGVSRGPVREALRALERAGLVKGVPNLGMFVRHIGIEEAIELYDMRGLIFAYCCSRVAEKATPDQHVVLDDLIAKMDDAIERGERSEYYQLNLDFHDRIMEFSLLRRASELYESLVKEGHLCRQKSLQPIASMRKSNAEHRKILSGIVANDPSAARLAGEEHHTGGKSRWLETLGQ